MTRRHAFFLGFLALVLVLPAVTTWAGEYSHARIVNLTLVQGDVQISSPGEAGWQKALAGTPLREGISLATGRGRLGIEFEDGAKMWLADDSVLRFEELGLADGKRITTVHITQGTATIYASSGRHDAFTVVAGQLTIRVKDQARFRVDVFEDGSSVSGYAGKVEVDTGVGTKGLGKGKTVSFRNDNLLEVATQANPAPDIWDNWVKQRDAQGDSFNDAAISSSGYSSQLTYSSYWGAAGYSGWMPGFFFGFSALNAYGSPSCLFQPLFLIGSRVWCSPMFGQSMFSPFYTPGVFFLAPAAPVFVGSAGHPIVVAAPPDVNQGRGKVRTLNSVQGTQPVRSPLTTGVQRNLLANGLTQTVLHGPASPGRLQDRGVKMPRPGLPGITDRSAFGFRSGSAGVNGAQRGSSGRTGSGTSRASGGPRPQRGEGGRSPMGSHSTRGSGSVGGSSGSRSTSSSSHPHR